ncbi:hypothetical protein Bca52824_096078 [Brassica carinata]|uniref:Aminopeptidase N-like N-terminal domain-containing protein n=1 Tax=Brassica carinata TaxID=52824 RepID=A0A8X7NXW1_BRACI|nr:hypothetical protein Bca52824_096078 [Brassica carinata]
MAPIDPHSFTDSSHPLTTHVSLSLYLDFSTSTIHATSLLTLSSSFSGTLSLDSRSISITTILDPKTLSPLPYTVSPNPDPIRGSEIAVVLSGQSQLLLVYSTSPSASALQWLSPPQTFSKSHPYVYTQCQAIHARSIFPCQDTPAARIRYDAVLNVPSSLRRYVCSSRASQAPVPEEAKHLDASLVRGG